MKMFIKAMKALSEPNRVKILKMLSIRDLCVCEIQNVLGIAQATVSKHLKILEEAEFVVSYKSGLWVNYSLNRDESNPCVSHMIKFIEELLNDNKQIKELVDKARKIDRTALCARKSA